MARFIRLDCYSCTELPGGFFLALNHFDLLPDERKIVSLCQFNLCLPLSLSALLATQGSEIFFFLPKYNN